MPNYKAGVLGATGAVGQKFIRLLQNHPWFTIEALGASERSEGKSYKEAVNWIENTRLPESVQNRIVKSCRPEHFREVDFVFSGLDSSVATEIEGNFAKAGIPVISNAKNYRTDPTVPLLIPEVNPDHITLIEKQNFSKTGWIVTNPNCVAVPLATTLKPLHEQFGVKAVILTSMQAVSGAGYPGVPSLDILGNVVPYIGGEESKIHEEPLKLLGTLGNGEVKFANIPIQATATRVPVINGHMLAVTVQFENKASGIREVEDAFRQWESPVAEFDLPSAPRFPVELHTDPHYPQPRLHADSHNGMQTAVGRVRQSNVFDISYVAMAHNTVRGAAGGAILNAELLVKKGYINEQ